MFFRSCLCYFCTIYTIAKVITQRTFDIVQKNRDHANIIGASLSEPHTYRTAGKNIRHIYIIYIYIYFLYIYIYIYIRPSVVHVPLTRYAQTSDWPVEVQWSI